MEPTRCRSHHRHTDDVWITRYVEHCTLTTAGNGVGVAVHADAATHGIQFKDDMVTHSYTLDAVTTSRTPLEAALEARDAGSSHAPPPAAAAR
jgi:hypothetical protein